MGPCSQGERSYGPWRLWCCLVAVLVVRHLCFSSVCVCDVNLGTRSRSFFRKSFGTHFLTFRLDVFVAFRTLLYWLPTQVKSWWVGDLWRIFVFCTVMFQIPKPPVVIEVVSPIKQETVFLVSYMRNYEIISSVSSTAWTWKLFQLCPQSKWPNYLNRNLDSTLLFSAPGSVAYNQEDTHLVWVSIQEFLKEKRPWKESFCVSSIQGCLSRRDELGGYDRWITNVLSLLTWSS
jgi:hypothetical protein